MDLQPLATELSTDPAGLGYASQIAANNVSGLVALVNDATRATVNRDSISRDSFLLAIVPAVQALQTADATVQAKYGPLLDLVKAADKITLIPDIRALVSGMVADGLMSQAQVDAILMRPGSRAEAVYGFNTIVSAQDIAIAVWGADR